MNISAKSPVMALLVPGLFVSSAMLSVVSWYTTFEGMALYLAGWFALLASVGVQLSLLLVAWLAGVQAKRRVQLMTVYAITAVVSIGFSYVSLYRWFSERERPAQVRRQVYDQLLESARVAEQNLASGLAEARRHASALDEMSASEGKFGHISRGADADPYLDGIRQAVAREAQAAGGAYREGSGEGVRYTAFARYARLSNESVRALESSLGAVATWREAAKPTDPVDKQLRTFRAAFDPIPWTTVSEALHGKALTTPETPSVASAVDQTSGGQEELLLAFTELLSAPTPRHVFSFALATFLDVIIFLVAFASGPQLAGAAEQRFADGAANMASMNRQVFLHGLLNKVTAAPGGLARLRDRELTAQEMQYLLLLTAEGRAEQSEDDAGIYWLLGQEAHAAMVDSLSVAQLPLQARRAATA